MFTHKSPELVFALDLACKSAAMARVIQSDLSARKMTKADLSPVTVGDFAIQALFGAMLEKTFVEDVLVAEESSVELRENEAVLEAVKGFVGEVEPETDTDSVCRWIDRGCGSPSERFWVLDPIDGTKGYLRGGQYAVAIALIQGGRVEIGVLACPELGEHLGPEPCAPGMVAVAMRGEGAWYTRLDRLEVFEPLRVSLCNEGAYTRILRSHENAHTNAGQIDRVAQALGVQAEPVRMDSQAKFAVLAGGGGELLLRMLSPSQPNYREKIWDLAAGALVVEEAGGRVTDLDGGALDYMAGRKLVHNRGVLATNGLLHDLALGAVREAELEL